MSKISSFLEDLSKKGRSFRFSFERLFRISIIFWLFEWMPKLIESVNAINEVDVGKSES